jgi:RNA polymerase sigma-70 factor (ECF subfamily)
MGPSDAQIIECSLAEPARFGAIFERHFATIHRYLNRRVGIPLADDLAAQVFTEAFARRARYDATRPEALPWLYGIATNLLRRHHRAEQRQLRAYARLGVDPVGPDELSSLLDRLDAARSGPALAGGLAALRPDDRDVLLLYAWAELGYREVADALGIPLGTVRSRLSRARQAMRDRLVLDLDSHAEQRRDSGEMEVLDGRA